MDTVRDNTSKAMRARLDHRKEHPKGGFSNCRLCRSYPGTGITIKGK